MNLQTPQEWAQQEFGLVDLKDKRLDNRLVKIAGALAHSPSGTMPSAFPLWADLKATYRLLDHLEFTFDDIQKPHREKTWNLIQEPGEYLLIEDTTQVDFSNLRHSRNLGPIGDGRGRGLMMHTDLAIKVQGWNLEQRPECTVAGLLHQEIWTRTKTGLRQENWRDRLKRPRESERWARFFAFTARKNPDAQYVYIADRESDFHEPMERCQDAGIDFVIRAYRDRRLAGEQGSLLERLAEGAVIGQMDVEIRGRTGEKDRVATMNLRTCRVEFLGPWRPGGNKSNQSINVVEVLEESPTFGSQPLHWILLTSLPCERLVELKRIVGRYCARWIIEEYHKALKTGTGVQESQLKCEHRLENLIAVLAIVAVRLLNTKCIARAKPEMKLCNQDLNQNEIKILTAKFGVPKEGWTNKTLWISIARLGGFLARKGDGMPGWITIWRGWSKLKDMCEGLEILTQSKNDVGNA